MDQVRIGKLISKLRQEKHLTQEELGSMLNVSKNAVSKWERGLCLMDLSLLIPLSEILEISVLELLNGELIKNNEYKEKSQEVIEKTLEYSYIKIKRDKIKHIIYTFLVTVIILFISFFVHKFVLLNRYSLKRPDNVNNVIEGLSKQKYLKIYKRTINNDNYLITDDLKIRNDFKDYIKSSTGDTVTFTDENNHICFSFGIYPQYIDMFASNELIFFSNDGEKYKDKFDYADRKFFLLKNDINDDLDFINFIKDNYYLSSCIFDSKRSLQENYSFNLFTSITIPEAKSITIIDGDYRGYILHFDKSAEIHIIRNNKNYLFFLYNSDNITEDYIKDLFSTLEIF